MTRKKELSDVEVERCHVPLRLICFIFSSVWLIYLTFFFFAFQQLFDEYPKCFIVNADNVGSKQMQQIRHALREKAGK